MLAVNQITFPPENYSNVGFFSPQQIALTLHSGNHSDIIIDSGFFLHFLPQKVYFYILLVRIVQRILIHLFPGSGLRVRPPSTRTPSGTAHSGPKSISRSGAYFQIFFLPDNPFIKHPRAQGPKFWYEYFSSIEKPSHYLPWLYFLFL